MFVKLKLCVKEFVVCDDVDDGIVDVVDVGVFDCVCVIIVEKV